MDVKFSNSEYTHTHTRSFVHGPQITKKSREGIQIRPKTPTGSEVSA
jgi:hypothetical protein